MTYPFVLRKPVRTKINNVHERLKDMAKENENKQVAQGQETTEFEQFPIDVKRNIVDIINDTPSLVRLGEKDYKVQNMRYYSLYRICNLVMDMRKADETLDTDQKIITALCTDLDAMCEIMAIVLCNHLFTPSDNLETWESVKTKNDYYISVMKAVVMQSTYDANQWAAIVLGAIKSIDLSAFFLLKKSVSTLTDSLLTRKKKSEETASLFMEALSLQTQQTSSEHSLNTD